MSRCFSCMNCSCVQNFEWGDKVMSDKETNWAAVVFQWIAIIGGIYIFIHTDADVPWKKTILDLFTTTAGTKIVDARESIQVGKYKLWKWKKTSIKDNLTLNVHFVSNSSKGLSVFVMDAHNLPPFLRNEDTIIFDCLSRKNVSHFDCSRNLDASIEEIAVIVYNPADSVSGYLGIEQEAPFELSVYALGGTDKK